MHQRLLRVSMMVMILLELITKTVLPSLPLQENFKNKTKEEKGSIFLQRERGQKQPQGHPIKLHRCLWPSEWYSMSNPPDRKYNSLKTQPSRTMNIQIVKRLVLSYSCITGPGDHKSEHRLDANHTRPRLSQRSASAKTENQFPHSTPVQLNTPEKS